MVVKRVDKSYWESFIVFNFNKNNKPQAKPRLGSASKGLCPESPQWGHTPRRGPTAQEPKGRGSTKCKRQGGTEGTT